MSLSDLANIGSFVSGIAVLISLVYLAVQVRQASKATLASMHEARAAAINTYLQPLASDPVLLDVVLRANAGDTSLNRLESWRYFYVWYPMVSGYEEQFYQHKGGTVDDAHHKSLVSVMTWRCQEPGFRAAWSIVGPSFGSEFVVFVGAIMAKVKGQPLPDFVDGWKAACENERSVAIPAMPGA
ncbi:MAG TPA: hypothetical protein VMF58_18300 [Rhizomicrobium sp.]|nr:hypothetical protein [Rhizomicrobium sp.]